MWYIYAMEYYSATKKNRILPFAATCIDLEDIVWSKIKCFIFESVSFSDRKTNNVGYHLYVESKKIIQMNVYSKAETDSQM